MHELIDPIFYNSETNEPFEQCMVCQCSLHSPEQEYFVERIMRRVPDLAVTECLFEYAVCSACAESMRGELSESSRNSIEQHFKQRLAQRGEELMEQRGSLQHCLLTGRPIEDSTEFSFHAHCRGGFMVQSIFPYAISDVAMDEVSELLSQATIDFLDDFKGKYFTGPPELADLLNPRRIIPL